VVDDRSLRPCGSTTSTTAAGVLAQVRSMQTGECIAIKAAYIKKHSLNLKPTATLSQ
jgi:hypothetical protein